MRYARQALLVGGVVVLLLGFPVGSYGASGANTWGGTWARGAEGPAGNLILTQIGATVTGHYTWNDGSGAVSGSVSGDTFTGGFNETNYQGSFVLTLSADGKSFSGSYTGKNKNTDGPVSGPFTGTCIGGDCLGNGAQPPPAPPPPPPPPPPPGGGTRTIPEPKPGSSSIFSQPTIDVGDFCGGAGMRAFAVATQACKTQVSISDSAGDLNGTTVVGSGGRTQTAGEAFAACWLIGPEAVDDSRVDAILPEAAALFANPSPQAQLEACLGLVLALYDSNGLRANRMLQAAGGCHSQRVTIGITLRKGKVVSHRVSRPLSSIPVRYACTGSGGSETIAVTSSSKSALRSTFGTGLRFGVHRSKKAPARSAKLTLTFGATGVHPSVTFTQGGQPIAAPASANDLEANIDPHTGVIANAYWTKEGKSVGAVAVTAGATGLVFATAAGASPGTPAARPSGATGFHVFWNASGLITSATWTRVGKPLATIAVAAGQKAIAFTSGPG